MNATLPMKKPHAPMVLPGKIIASVKDQHGRLSPDKDEQERVEYIVGEIVRRLRLPGRSKKTEREVRVAVVTVCGLIMQNVGVPSPAGKRSELPVKLQPAAIKNLTNDIREQADSRSATQKGAGLWAPLLGRRPFAETDDMGASYVYALPAPCGPDPDKLQPHKGGT
jgi:hypothetical protein